ncbi:MAG: hypothetical protein KGL13_05010 [Gammaproteobacteria bacterium]|nr:hypothetical protein [Gammaproteobacteria bacterium]
MKWMVLTLAVMMVSACSTWETRQHASELSQMRQDDEACVAKGRHYPDADYISCRYQLQNDRAYYAWKCLQMTKCPRGLPNASPQPITQTEEYKPLDEARFHCWKVTQFGGDYIYCGVKQAPE